MQLLFSPEDLDQRIDRMADEIIAAMPDDVVVVPILTGAFMLAADLSRALARRGRNWEVEFLHLSSYGAGRKSSGTVKLVKDINADVGDRAVLLVDDVLDTGTSLAFASELMRARRASMVKVCVLIDKKAERPQGVDADFVGFEAAPDRFIIGYGMDDAGKHRGLPGVYAIDEGS